MTFTEPPDPSLSIVHVLDVNAAPTLRRDRSRPCPAHGDQLRIPLPASLPDGVYTVSWRVVSEADGHATAGAFSFGVNVAPGTVVTPSVPVPTTPSPSVAQRRGQARCCTSGSRCRSPPPSWGSLAFGGRVPERKRVLRFAAASAVVGVVGDAPLGARHARRVDGRPAVVRDGHGLPLAARRRDVRRGVGARRGADGPDRTSLVVAGVAAAAAMLTRAIGGHAAAAATPALQIGLQWLHFMAASVWMGGLALTFLWLRVQRRTEGAVPVDEVRRVLVPGRLRAGRRARHRRAPRDAGGRRPLEAVRSVLAARTGRRSTSR